jgi:hypothetical protein
MPKATIKGLDCRVVVNSDLVDNWAVEVFPPPLSKAKLKGMQDYVSQAHPTPVCIKIRADTKEDALKAGLECLKNHGEIDDFYIEPENLPKPPVPGKKKEVDEDAEAEAE